MMFFMILVIVVIVVIVIIVIFEDCSVRNVVVLEVRFLEAISKVYSPEVALNCSIKTPTVVYILCLATERP